MERRIASASSALLALLASGCGETRLSGMQRHRMGAAVGDRRHVPGGADPMSFGAVAVHEALHIPPEEAP